MSPTLLIDGDLLGLSTGTISVTLVPISTFGLNIQTVQILGRGWSDSLLGMTLFLLVKGLVIRILHPPLFSSGRYLWALTWSRCTFVAAEENR